MNSFELPHQCPFCMDLSASGKYDPVCYLNEDKGLYNCFRCQKGGSVTTPTVIDINRAPRKPQDPDSKLDVSAALDKLTINFPDEALYYLSDRFPGVDLSHLINTYNLMYHEYYGAIALLGYNPNQELISVKYRILRGDDNNKYISEAGSMNGFYAVPGKDSTKVLLVEGELDAITASILGFDGEVWAMGTTKLRKERVAKLRSFKQVYMIPDTDQYGQAAAREIEQLTKYKAQIISLPEEYKDINELLQLQGFDKAKAWLTDALIPSEERVTTDFTSSFKNTIHFLKNRRISQGITTGYKQLDQRLGGGWRISELTVINAEAKTGKSTFVNNIINNLLKHGEPVGLASFEMDPEKYILPALIGMNLQLNVRKQNDESLDALSNDIPEFDHLKNLKFYRQHGHCTFKKIDQWIRYRHAKDGIKFFFLDHSLFLLNDGTSANENTQLGKSLELLTQELPIHIQIVVQAPKIDRNHTPHLTLNTAYGGASWSQNCYNYITLERSREHADVLEVRLLRARYAGNKASEEPILLCYDSDTGLLQD